MDSEIIAQLPQLEVACDILYNSQVSDRKVDDEEGCGNALANVIDVMQVLEERSKAELYLRPFGQSVEYVPHCKASTELSVRELTAVLGDTSDLILYLQVLLHNSQSAYAQLLACSSLLKIVTEHTLRSGLSL